MIKIIVLLFLILFSNTIIAQNYRKRKNEFGVNIFTAYDFDKFSIINKNKVQSKNIPFNEGYGILFERTIKKSYYLKANISSWHPWRDKVLPLGSIVTKDAHFFGLGIGKIVKENKFVRAKINSQFIFRHGAFLSYTGSFELLTHYYRDFGISLAADGQVKINRFFAFNLSAGYIFYFVKYNHLERDFHYKPIDTRHSIMIHLGFSFLF